MTPFTRYRQGYIDGYEGVEPALADDRYYMRGYSEGQEDDQEGAEAKYFLYVPEVQ